MKKSLKVLLIIAVLAFATFSAVLGTKVLSEERITTNTYDEKYPAIYGDIVVWSDNRNGNWDIYGYNLKTKEVFQITSDSSLQAYLAIYGDIVVCEHIGYADIWGYNLKTKDKFQITPIGVYGSYPAIYCGQVVWMDFRNGEAEIYLGNLDVSCGTVEVTRVSIPIAQIAKILGLFPKE